jgi:histone-lysine N-methyltransferase SETMAR
MMEHPPYSPDLAPSDFHMFSPMKETLRGRRLSSDEEVIGAVQNWLKTQRKIFSSDGIKKKKLKRWNRALKSKRITLKSNKSLVSDKR